MVFSPQDTQLKNQAIGVEGEKGLTSRDQSRPVQVAPDIDRVIKRFYAGFKKKRDGLLKSIVGLPDDETRQLYTSVLINRLLFLYFIQQKGCLNSDRQYLLSQLAQSKQHGENLFYSGFLLKLFAGLATKETERAAATRRRLGQVPYFHGSLFLRHPIEITTGKHISIPDAAFEKLFAFFQEWDFHLDERSLRGDRDINPDVLGYILERYINQKQMGAYYTKADITAYIGKNTIIPFLFDPVRLKDKAAFASDAAIRRLLRNDPDRYFYGSMIKGTAVMLPTETWREVAARQKRYQEVRAMLTSGELSTIDDCITHNLNLQQLAQDVLSSCENPNLLLAFWRSIAGVSVLDPTCGSGAFLLAALDILAPLYEVCLDRMQRLLSKAEALNESIDGEVFEQFHKVIAHAAAPPGRRYFIVKSIITSNLFGVDIMAEAVEICKLRLCLKLVAQVETGEQIEPLPDIDFNIRTGNALIGFATRDDARNAVKGQGNEQFERLFDDSWQRIVEQAQELDSLFELFRQQQMGFGSGAFIDKQDLHGRLASLAQELNRHLAGEHRINLDENTDYEKWLHFHKPFHWFVEFHNIMNEGGFDVIIGNPPYVNAAAVRKQYVVKNLATSDCPDIYAWVLERAAGLLKQEGRSGMIVPLSLSFSSDFEACRKIIFQQYGRNWFSSFARIPAALFNFDVRVRNTIHIGHKTETGGRNYTSRLHRWFEAARPYLFETLEYAPFDSDLWQKRIPKFNTHRLSGAFAQCLANTGSTLAASFIPKPMPEALHFKKTAYNWLNFCRELPPCYASNGEPIPHTKFGTVYFADAKTRDLAFLLLNGKIMFAFWCVTGDDFDVTQWMFASFPIDLRAIPDAVAARLLPLANELAEAMQANLSFKLNAGKKVGNYNLAKCRSVTDKSDALFALLLGLEEAWPDIELLYSQIVKTDFTKDSEQKEPDAGAIRRIN